ncbi:MAG: hypothetical protein IJ064_05690 [Bacteroidaceae bacterium]|nr:hypothetical protein [Bacteroidaceae bacterium]
MKFDIKEFDTILYPRKIWVAKGGVKKDIARHFNDDEGDPLWVSTKDVDSSKAITIDTISDNDTGNYGVLVWLHDLSKCDIATIAHEADHVANAIFQSIGAKVDCENDETHAYLVGFAAECIWKVKTGRYGDK